MTRPRPDFHRRADAWPIKPLDTRWSDAMREQEAALSSDILTNSLRNAGLEPESIERRPLSFEEQLAAVARGARIVAVIPIRKADPDFTLGGVSW